MKNCFAVSVCCSLLCLYNCNAVSRITTTVNDNNYKKINTQNTFEKDPLTEIYDCPIEKLLHKKNIWAGENIESVLNELLPIKKEREYDNGLIRKADVAQKILLIYTQKKIESLKEASCLLENISEQIFTVLQKIPNTPILSNENVDIFKQESNAFTLSNNILSNKNEDIFALTLKIPVSLEKGDAFILSDQGTFILSLKKSILSRLSEKNSGLSEEITPIILSIEKLLVQNQKIINYCNSLHHNSKHTSLKEILLSLMAYPLVNRKQDSPFYYFCDLIANEHDRRESYYASFEILLSKSVNEQSARLADVISYRENDKEFSRKFNVRETPLMSYQMQIIVDSFTAFYLHLIGAIKYSMSSYCNDIIEGMINSKQKPWEGAKRKEKIPPFVSCVGMNDFRFRTRASNIGCDIIRVQTDFGRDLVNIINANMILVENGYYELCEEMMNHIKPVKKLKALRNADYCMQCLNDSHFISIADDALTAIYDALTEAKKVYPNGSFMSTIKLDLSSLRVKSHLKELQKQVNSDSYSSSSSSGSSSCSSSSVSDDDSLKQNEEFTFAPLDLDILMRAPDLCELAWNNDYYWKDNEKLNWHDNEMLKIFRPTSRSVNITIDYATIKNPELLKSLLLESPLKENKKENQAQETPAESEYQKKIATALLKINELRKYYDQLLNPKIKEQIDAQ